MRPGRAVLEHVLSVEVRALAVGTRERLEHDELARRVALLQESKRWVQAEEAIERQRATGLTRSAQGELAPQLRIIAVAEWRDRCEPIERTAHDHQHQARGAGVGMR